MAAGVVVGAREAKALQNLPTRKRQPAPSSCASIRLDP